MSVAAVAARTPSVTQSPVEDARSAVPSGRPAPARPPISRLAARRVQALLRVGAAGDSYEQEADSIARDLTGPPPASRPSPDASAHAGHAEPVVGPGGGDTPIPAVERQSGGRPLPAPTRAYFEEHLGRDLSAVRLHDGDDGARVTESVGAAALTYGDHIWLGAGVATEPSHVLAHELVHVAQQTGEPPVARRALPYWTLPGRRAGERTHEALLPEIGQEGRIFTEAPIPCAGLTGAGYGKRGRADLYDASTTIGVNFEGHQTPVRLGAPRMLRKDGERYSHQRLAAPTVGRLQDLQRVDRAPTDILIGDLKPQGGSLPALLGVGQVANYVEGILLAKSEANELLGAAGPQWQASPQAMNRTRLRRVVPAKYNPRRLRSSSQPERDLILKQDGRDVEPRTTARGKVALAPDPVNAGVLNYVWVPSDSSLPTITLPASVRRLGTEVTNRLMRPVRQAPLTRGRSGSGARTGRRFSLPSTPQPLVRRRLPGRRAQRLQRDPFNLGTWRADHRRLRGTRRGVERRDDLDPGRRARAIANARRGLEAAGVPMPQLPAAMTTAARTTDRVEFWTGSRAPLLARFRSVFGRLFIKVANAYDRMRERFQRRARRPGGGGGGGLAGAAVKVAVTVLRSAMRVIVRRTMQILQASLVAGVRRKLESLIGEDNIAELQERVDELDALRQEMEAQARETAEALFQRAFGPYEEMVDRFDQIQQIMTGFMRVINLVRWGARALACGAPPVIGCLWGLAQGVLEEFAALIIGTCWFQRKVTPLLLRLDLVRRLPERLAATILETVREAVPPSMRDVFGEIEVPQITADEVECDPWGEQPEIRESQLALMRMQEQLGEERFEAWLQLVQMAGVPEDTPLTLQRADAVVSAIRDSGVSAAQLRRYANDVALLPETVPVDVRTFLREMGSDRLPPAPGVSEAGGGPVDEAPGAVSEEESSGGGPRVATAEGAPTGRQLEDRREFVWGMEILSGIGRGDYQHHRVGLRVRLSAEIGGQPVSAVVGPLQVRVMHRRRVVIDGQRTMRVTLRTVGRGVDQVFQLAPPLLDGRLHSVGIKNGVEFDHYLEPVRRPRRAGSSASPND